MKNIQAFPRPYSKDDYGDYPVACKEQDGMTLRDYFAGQVLTGFMNQHALRFDPIDDANYCYKVADAMLEERDK